MLAKRGEGKVLGWLGDFYKKGLTEAVFSIKTSLLTPVNNEIAVIDNLYLFCSELIPNWTIKLFNITIFNCLL